MPTHSEHKLEVEKFATRIVGCARCGENHEEIEFRRFSIQPIECGSETFEYWAICPKTGEPILCKIDDNEAYYDA